MGIFQGKSIDSNTVVYFVSYGLSARNNSRYFTPNLIKANLRDKLGNAKFDLEKHYRRKLEAGKSFMVTASFCESNLKVK